MHDRMSLRQSPRAKEDSAMASDFADMAAAP